MTTDSTATDGMRVRIGEPVQRREDVRLLTGAGRYADDVKFDRITHAIFVRSPHAHAKLRRITVAAARRAPGVLAVLTGQDALAAGLRPIPHVPGAEGGGADIALIDRPGFQRVKTPNYPIVTDKARAVGEIVAIVVAETVAAAKDGADLVEVEYEPLPAVSHALDAVATTAPRLWDEHPSNLCIDADVGDRTATDAAFTAAAHVSRIATLVQRVTGVHLEPRAAIGDYDAATGRTTLYAAGGHGVVAIKSELAVTLGIDPATVRVVAHDVGGSFGTRNALNPDFALIAWAARVLGRPVKHVAERQEAFVTDYQGRDLWVEAELALDKDGNFLALRSSNLSNVGAHSVSFVALNKGAQLMTTVYRVPAVHVRARAVMSNTPPTIPFRSAGRPEVIFAVERLIDIAAREHGFDPVTLRRRNLVPPEAFPHPNGLGITYDSGDYPQVMATALELGDWAGFPARRAATLARGKRRGIGIGCYVETASGMPRERAEIAVLPEGRIDLILGTMASGQGHETAFPQLVADWLGVPIDRVRFRAHDTDFVTAGGGSHSGRSMRIASIVIRQATFDVIAKGKEIAAQLLEVAPADLDFADGRFTVQGTDRRIGLFEVAAAALTRDDLAENLREPLGAVSDQVVRGGSFPFGCHVAEVEVDPETGAVAVLRYAAVDDVGKAINPLLLHGQTHGGIAMGVGQALLEHAYYDRASGQMLAGSLMDYALPRADDLPSFATAISEVPATSHPLGIRPGGEGGTTPALAAVINAICDALAEFGVTHVEMPATPERVWRAIREARFPQVSS
jgi:carbon-monoxide dehydrogenase large subunit